MLNVVNTSIAVASIVANDEENATLKAVRIKLLSQDIVNTLTLAILMIFPLLYLKIMSRSVKGNVRYVTPIRELIIIPVTIMLSSELKVKAG